MHVSVLANARYKIWKRKRTRGGRAGREGRGRRGGGRGEGGGGGGRREGGGGVAKIRRKGKSKQHHKQEQQHPQDTPAGRRIFCFNLGQNYSILLVNSLIPCFVGGVKPTQTIFLFGVDQVILVGVKNLQQFRPFFGETNLIWLVWLRLPSGQRPKTYNPAFTLWPGPFFIFVMGNSSQRIIRWGSGRKWEAKEDPCIRGKATGRHCHQPVFVLLKSSDPGSKIAWTQNLTAKALSNWRPCPEAPAFSRSSGNPNWPCFWRCHVVRIVFCSFCECAGCLKSVLCFFCWIWCFWTFLSWVPDGCTLVAVCSFATRPHLFLPGWFSPTWGGFKWQ